MSLSAHTCSASTGNTHRPTQQKRQSIFHSSFAWASAPRPHLVGQLTVPAPRRFSPNLTLPLPRKLQSPLLTDGWGRRLRGRSLQSPKVSPDPTPGSLPGPRPRVCSSWPQLGPPEIPGFPVGLESQGPCTCDGCSGLALAPSPPRQGRAGDSPPPSLAKNMAVILQKNPPYLVSQRPSEQGERSRDRSATGLSCLPSLVTKPKPTPSKALQGQVVGVGGGEGPSMDPSSCP